MHRLAIALRAATDHRLHLRCRLPAMCLLVVLAASLPPFARAVSPWSTLGGNAQHTGLATTSAQAMESIHWSTPVDTVPPGGDPVHYGSPTLSPANTVVVPVRTSDGSYRVDARAGANGALIWTLGTDYVLPPHTWVPGYSPGLVGNRVYFAGAGGTVYYRDNVDAAIGDTGHVTFFGLAAYQANRAAFDATVFVNTAIVGDANGNIYFGFRTSGTPPLGLQSGIARIDAFGNGSWVSAAAASGDAIITRVPHQAAPALSADGQTLYVAVADGGGANAYLLGLDPATLTLKQAQPGVPMRARLQDPRNSSNAQILDESSASPMVGPDGDVYYGVMGNPFNGSRGWLLHFSADLTQTRTPGAFGWDNTAAVVPKNAVPSYTGASPYLVFSKYNNYAGTDGGDGVNKIAVLDPNATMVEPHPSSNGLLVMKEVLTIAGPTPDADLTSQFPNAVREWCINAAAVDPFTKAVVANSEDGKVYRWDLTTNTLSQAVTLSPGVGEAYTSTVIGPDGTVYATNWAILNAVGTQNPTPIMMGAASRKRHGASGPVFDLALASTPAHPSVEPRSGGGGSQHTVVFFFNKPVASGTASITEGTASLGVPSFNANEVSVPLSGVTNAQYVTVSLSNVTAADGSPGGSGLVRIGFLVGDTNGNRSVSLSDVLAVNASLSQAVTAANYLRDVNVDGALTLADTILANANLTQVLPPP